jgi:hypothetical protein
LARKLATHYALHKAEITTDIGSLENDWDAGNYFDAGKDLADIATLAIGPIQSELTADPVSCGDFTLNTVEVADFLAGFVHGFSGHDHKAEFETCFHDTPEFEEDICSIYSAIKTKDNEQIINAVHTILGDMPKIKSYLSACTDATADVQVVGDWYRYWKDQGTMKVYQTAYGNVIHNMDTIKADASTMEADYDKQDYYGTADMAASVAKIALPVEASFGYGASADCGDFTLNTVEVADFLSGFVHGFSGNDHKAEMETCFKDTDAFELDVCSIVKAIITKDNDQIM